MNDTIISLPNGDFSTTRYLKDHYYKTGHLGLPKEVVINRYMLTNNRVDEVHSVIVHRFRMGDVEDPDLYAAQPLWEWQQSEMGAWIMERSVETPMWHRQMNTNQYHMDYAIEAWLRGVDYSFWVLKWGNEVDRTGTFSI
jgi:hypothetical protein